MENPRQVYIEGGVPLVGSVPLGGSRALALKLIYASVLCGEVCTLTNIPKSRYTLDDLDLIQEVGVKVNWAGNNKLSVDARHLLGEVIPLKKGAKVTTAGFLVPALVHKYGKAVLPKSVESVLKVDRGRQYAHIWQSLGMEIKEDFDNYYIEAVKLQSGEVILPYPSRILTDMAILSTLFILGESTIRNASLDVETDDLLDFCTKIGGNVQRLENGSICVNGSGVFKGIDYEVPFDREEAAFYILATLLTNGNTTLQGLERARLLPFLNWLSKVGANYEFLGSTMRVWHNGGTSFSKTEVKIAPHPGFITDYAPLVVVLDCFAQGDSVVLENLLTTNTAYLKDLTRLGASITAVRDAENTAINISGPANLKPGRVVVQDLRTALVFLLYALSVEGKNELAGFEVIEEGFESIVARLKALGAVISE